MVPSCHWAFAQAWHAPSHFVCQTNPYPPWHLAWVPIIFSWHLLFLLHSTYHQFNEIIVNYEPLSIVEFFKAKPMPVFIFSSYPSASQHLVVECMNEGFSQLFPLRNASDPPCFSSLWEGTLPLLSHSVQCIPSPVPDSQHCSCLCVSRDKRSAVFL